MATADRRTFAEPGPSPLRSCASWSLCGVALASFALLTGCGGEEHAAEPKGGFAVAGDDAGKTDSEGETGGPRSLQDRDSSLVGEAAAPGNPNAGAVAPPPSLAMEEFEVDPVPQNATAAQLMQYLKTLNARQQELQQLARGMTQDEVVQRFVDLQRKRIEASALLLVAEDAEDTARQEAIDLTLGSFNSLGQLGQDVTTEYEAFLAKHSTDRDPVISRYTRSMKVAAGLGKIAGAENPTQEQADAALAEVDKLLAEVEPNGPTLGILAGAVGDLASMDRLDLASALIAKLDAAYGGVQDPELQTLYKNAVGGAKASLVSVALQKVAAETNPPQEQVDAALAQLDQFLATSQPSAEMFQAVASTASILMQQNQTQLAAAVLQRLGDAYVKLEDPELKQRGEVALVQAKLTALDIAKLMAAVGAGEDEPANRLVDVARQLVSEATPPPIAYLGVLNQFAQNLEYVHKYQQSGALYSLIAETYGTSADAEVAKEAGDIAQAGLKRLGLIGTKLELQGQAVGGAPFDWESYRGKVVLVDFWATWCQPCLAEIPNVEANLRKYKDQGFDVVAVNLDDDLATVQQFLAANPLPWATIVSDDPAKMGFQSPMATKCGVEAIPFVLLVDRDGVVLDIHVRGADLGKKLAEIFGAPAGTAPAGSSPTGTGAASPPIEGVPGLEGPGSAAPPAENPSTPAPRPGGGLPDLQPLRSSAIENVFDDGVWFVSASVGATATDETLEDDAASAKDEADEKAPANDEELFLASPDLTLDELVDFLFDMEEKPRSVQALKGFDAGVIDACDRIWRNPDATVPQLRLAATTKLKRLHRAGTMGNVKADVELAAYVERLAENPDEGIASWVELVRLENEAVAGETLSAEKLPDLLTKLRTYFERIAAEERHLRLASLTVRLINRIDDPTADEEGQKEFAAKREEQYKSFGELFAKSENKELSRYGKKLAKPPAAQESDLVGKPLELQGDLADGGSFDWATYRGKVVIVDFWATWCGPCRREMPHVKEAFDRMNADGFEVVGISLDEDQEALAEYLEENQIEWATLVGDGSMQLAERYGVRGIPTMMLVDRDGTVLMVGHQAQPLIDKAIELLAAR